VHRGSIIGQNYSEHANNFLAKNVSNNRLKNGKMPGLIHGIN